LGGPGFPRCLQVSVCSRRGAVPGCVLVPWSCARPGPSRRALSTVIGAAGSVVVLGRSGGGLGEPRNRAVIFRGRGGSGVPPGTCTTPSSCCLFRSQSRAVVFPTSPSLLVEGVRSGTRRRRGPPTSPQAAGGTGPGRPRTAPVHARTGLVKLVCGNCTHCVRAALATDSDRAGSLRLPG